MLTIRHLFPGGGVSKIVSKDEYILSVYEVWSATHAETVADWYARLVAPD